MQLHFSPKKNKKKSCDKAENVRSPLKSIISLFWRCDGCIKFQTLLNALHNLNAQPEYTEKIGKNITVCLYTKTCHFWNDWGPCPDFRTCNAATAGVPDVVNGDMLWEIKITSLYKCNWTPGCFSFSPRSTSPVIFAAALCSVLPSFHPEESQMNFGNGGSFAWDWWSVWKHIMSSCLLRALWLFLLAYDRGVFTAFYHSCRIWQRPWQEWALDQEDFSSISGPERGLWSDLGQSPFIPHFLQVQKGKKIWRSFIKPTVFMSSTEEFWILICSPQNVSNITVAHQVAGTAECRTLLLGI